MRQTKNMTSKRNKELIICHHLLRVCFVQTMRLGSRSHRGHGVCWDTELGRQGQEGRAGRGQAESGLEEMSRWWYWSRAGRHIEFKGVWPIQVPTSKGYTVARGLKSDDYNIANTAAWWFEHKSPGNGWDGIGNIHLFIHTFVHASNAYLFIHSTNIHWV